MLNLKFSAYDNFDDIDTNLHYVTCRFKDTGQSETMISGSYNSDGGYRFDVSSGTKGLAWRRLDNRINTFYGSTYEVPLSDYEIHSEAYRICICGNTHLMSKYASGMIYRYTINPKDEPPDYDKEYYPSELHTFEEQQRIVSLKEYILKSYPNAIISEYGDFVNPVTATSFSSSYITELNDDLNTIIDGYDEDDPSSETDIRQLLPTHIVLGGVEQDFHNDHDLGRIKSLLSNIISVCRIFNIRLVIVTDPYFIICDSYNALRSYIEETIPNDYLLDVAKWRTDARASNYFPLDTEYFYDYVYNYICDKVLDKWELHIHRDRYYVSLISEKITDTSYDDFMKKISVGHYAHRTDYVTDVYHKLSLDRRESDIVWNRVPYIEQYHVNKYGSGNQSPNLFMNTGQRFVVVVHTGYSDTLFANEQFQANTNYEFLCQTDTCGENYTGRNLINTLPVRRPLSNGSENPAYHSTVYPGTGAPWFVISDDNIDDYTLYTSDRYGLNKHMLYDCWLTFSDTINCTITIRVNGNHEYLDNWQSISFGRFPYKQTENYSYSLYCAGGSLGISNDVYVYVPNGGGTKTYVHGNSYDLDFHNVSWGHPATLLTPVKFNGANTSNFRVLSIEGVWKNIYAKTQDAIVAPYPTAGPPPDYATVLGTLYDVQSSDHYLYPTCSNDLETESSKYINNRGYNNIVGINYLIDNYEMYNTQFIPVTVFFDAKKDHYESCQCSTVPNVFCTYDREIVSGEYTAEDGSKYLIVPCGWDGRLFAYDYNYAPGISHRFRVINDYWEACDVVDLYESFMFPRGKYSVLVRYKLAIRIG